MMHALTLVAALSTGQLPPWMTGESRGEDLTVTLVTFSPGDSVPEWWGHTALVVEDGRLKQGRLYNYGMFGFDKFWSTFVMGRLEFWVSDGDSIGGTFNFYKQYLNRDVRLQILNLLPDQALQVARALGTNVLPENRVYLYQHYDDNCSTRPRDLIDAAIGGQLKAATAGPARMTLREHTLRYSRVNPPMSLVLDFLQNGSLDVPITMQQEAYLPDELERQVAALTVKRPDGSTAKLVRRQFDWFKSDREPPPERPPNWNLWLLGLGLAIGGVVLGLGHLGRGGGKAPRVLLGLFTSLFGLLGGVFGTVLFLMGLFTNHQVTHHNENLFLFNPVHVALVPLGVMLARNSPRARPALLRVCTAVAVITVLGVLLKPLPGFVQNNWNLVALLGPVNLSLAALWWLDRRVNKQA
jgi:hypothetical protein